MTLTLISDIISRKIVSRAYLQHNIRGRNPIVRARVRACACVCVHLGKAVCGIRLGQSVLADHDL